MTTRTTTSLHSTRTAWLYWWPLLALAGLAVTVATAAAVTDSGRPSFASALQAPSATAWAGTDHFGHDLLARTVDGLQTSLLIAAACAAIATAIGAAIGVLAATAGGAIDSLVMRLVDGVNALPHLVLGVLIAAMWRGANVNLGYGDQT